MVHKLKRKIFILSKALKLVCIVGIILFPILIFINWIFGDYKIQLLKSNWYILFSDVPYIPIDDLSFQMKMIGIFVDFIPCAFFISILFILSKLFKQYEHLFFFSKENIRYIRWVAILLFCKTLIYPFYLALRNYIFMPLDQNHSLMLFGPNEFKSFLITFAVILVAYIMEVALYLEEELTGTI